MDAPKTASGPSTSPRATAARTSDGPVTAPSPPVRPGATPTPPTPGRPAVPARQTGGQTEPKPGIRVGSTPPGGVVSSRPTVPAVPATAPPAAPATRTDPPQPDPRTGSGAAPARPTGRGGPRRARLMVTRLDPWSVMKTFFVLSLAVAIVLVVAVALLWWTLDFTGVFAAIDRTVDDVVGTGTVPFNIQSMIGFSRVMGATLVVCAVEIVLVSAMATLFAFLYNLSVGFTRGLEVTLSEDQ